MKKENIIKASSVFKKTEQERIGYFHNDISLGCILYRFSETIQWAYLNDLLGIMED